jgi:hypothetical protein
VPELVEVLKLEAVPKPKAVPKLDEALKPEGVTKEDAASKGSSIGLSVASAFAGVAVVAGPDAGVAACVALSTGRLEITVAVSNRAVPASSWLGSNEYRVDAAGAGLADAEDCATGCGEPTAVWLGVNDDATSFGSVGESDCNTGASWSPLTSLSGAAGSADRDRIATCCNRNDGFDRVGLTGSTAAATSFPEPESEESSFFVGDFTAAAPSCPEPASF